MGRRMEMRIYDLVKVINSKEEWTLVDIYADEGITGTQVGKRESFQRMINDCAEGKIDMLIFFCDNLITQGHQQDVGALSRLASLYNIAFATNRTTADMILTSSLFDNEDYVRVIPTAIEK